EGRVRRVPRPRSALRHRTGARSAGLGGPPRSVVRHSGRTDARASDRGRAQDRRPRGPASWNLQPAVAMLAGHNLDLSDHRGPGASAGRI
ncbi:hypothetical protein LTR94_031600, partial [Friedmanniomyces endolithicus]